MYLQYSYYQIFKINCILKNIATYLNYKQTHNIFKLFLFVFERSKRVINKWCFMNNLDEL